MTTSLRKNRGCLSAIFGFGSDKDDNPTTSAMPGDENTKDPMPFRLRDDFLSTAEHSFYQVLKTMMGSVFTICPKVSLSDIFFVTNPNENMGAYNRINRKHVDFLICDATTMKPRFAIELDDKSHNREDRMERDDFVELLFEVAELPLVRIPARSMYNTNEMGILFREALAQKPAAPNSGPTIHPFTVPVEKPSTNQTVRSVAELVSKPISRPLPEPVEGNPFVGSTSSPTGESTSGQAPICPKCGQPMVLRTAGIGVNKGNQFWGCVNYPKCKAVITY